MSPETPRGPTPETASREAEVAPTRDPAPPEWHGACIGQYKCLQIIGEGAMGLVYMAEQSEPVRRRVALKVIKPGMDSEQILARFDAERQALALMNHDNIARVFDAGTVSGSTAQGRPYFVMELVKGVAVTKFCDDQRLAIEQRLELFVQICHAVQHAHLKGIIHRDLKPSNVLVALADGRPVPKIIDFGLAKAMHQPLTDRTMFTNLGALLGTLEYMSPEQADLGALDIDTRTDVYALGSMLYEMLAGTSPLASVQLRKQGYTEAIRLIRETDPARPSERVAQAGGRLPALAAQRQTDTSRLCKTLRGDLDCIVMKAIEKNRAARYQTASELAADLERFLKHEPIAARAPSFWYPVRKFMLRHRAAVVATAVILFLLIAATAVSTWMALRASAAEREARESAAISQAVNEFLREDVLGQANPMKRLNAKEKPDPDMKLRTALDRAAARIPGRFPDQPLVEAAIRETIGEAYHELSVFPAAETHLQASFDLLRKHRGEQHPQTMEVREKLASAYWMNGKLQAHEEALMALVPYYKRQFGETHTKTLEVLNSLGLSYLDLRKYDLAEPALLQVYEGRRKTLGEEDAATLNSLNCLGYLYMKQDRFDQAEPYYVQALHLRRKVLTVRHPHTQNSIFNLGELYDALGKFDAAEVLYRESLSLNHATRGEENAHGAMIAGSLGSLLAHRGKVEEAEPLLRKSLEIDTRIYGERATVTAYATRLLAECLLLKGDTEEALALARRSQSTYAAVGAKSRSTAESRVLLGTVLMARAQFADAEVELNEALVIYEKDDPTDWRRYAVTAKLGQALAGKKQYAKAEPLLLEGYEGMSNRVAFIPAIRKPFIRETGEQIVRLYEAWGKPDKVKEWRSRLDTK